LVKCFDFDWQFTKIEKLIKNEEQINLCKTFLRKNYKYVREAYKHTSGELPIGRLPCIGSTTFNLMMGACPDLVDGKILKFSDVDLEYVATNSAKL
jgi:hypothetical protein